MAPALHPPCRRALVIARKVTVTTLSIYVAPLLLRPVAMVAPFIRLISAHARYLDQRSELLIVDSRHPEEAGSLFLKVRFLFMPIGSALEGVPGLQHFTFLPRPGDNL
jgi:hypothetical protein